MQNQVLNYSATIQDDGTFRLDAEHYQKQYLENQKKLTEFGSLPLLDLLARPVMTGHTPSMKVESFYGGDIKFVKTDNLREFEISGEFTHYLSESGNEVISRSALETGDLIITIIGATHKIVGRAALVRKEDLPANINQNIALVRLKKKYSPEFLSAYLNSKIGRLALWFLSRQTEQVNLNCREVEKVLVPNVSGTLTKQISNTYKKAVTCEHKSRDIFKEAENLILSELSLTNWQPKHQLSFVKNYSDTKEAGRIDADYFQPFYEEVNKKIKSTGFVLVKDICSHINYGTVPTSPYSEDNSGVPYIKGLNLKGLQVVTDKLDYITNTKDLRSKVFTTEGDIVISQMGTVGNCGVVSKEQENWVFASFTIRIRISDKLKYDPYFVAFYIENIAKPYYLMRNIAQASVRQNTDLPTIRNTPIPSVPIERQQEISDMITKSLGLRKQSRHLLESAKKAVEMAIEQDEQKASGWLKSQADRLF